MKAQEPSREPNNPPPFPKRWEKELKELQSPRIKGYTPYTAKIRSFQ